MEASQSKLTHRLQTAEKTPADLLALLDPQDDPAQELQDLM